MFFLVDVTDGITPETGEAGGQPQISVDGASFTATGIGVLVHMGNGQYYAEVTQATVNVTSGLISGRYKSAATLEAPSLSILKVVTWDPQTAPQTALDRIGAVTGSGTNTLLGILQALLRNDAAIPSDIGGSYDATTDSQQSLRDRLRVIEGTSFATGTDSLRAIAQAIAESVVIGVGSTFAFEGFLSRVVANVRNFTNEPETNAKYNNDDILRLMCSAWSQLWTELNLTADNAPVVRYDVNIVKGRQDYFLPPNIGEILRLYRVNADTKLSDEELIPRSYYNPVGPGFTIEGNVLRLTPVWDVAKTFRLEYIPSGEICPHQGSGKSLTSTTFELDQNTSSMTGAFDGRENAYAGYALMIHQGDAFGKMEERFITSYDLATHVVTVSPAFTLTPIDELKDYELVPQFGIMFELVLSQMVSRSILVVEEGTTKRYTGLTQDYREKVRALRIKLTNIQARRADRFEGDVVENRRFGSRFPLK